MKIEDLKGQLLVRCGNLEQRLQGEKTEVAVAEANLVTARRRQDTTAGALQEAQRTLGELEKVIAAVAVQAPESTVAAPLPAPTVRVPQPGSKPTPPPA